MLSIESALERCLTAALPVQVERVPLHAAAGRVLAEDLVSGVDLPHWDNAAMDGFAVRAADLRGLTAPDGDACAAPPAAEGAPGVRLRVVETIPAGGWPRRAVGAGEAARIMTGAPMPPGADAVVMREDTTDGEAEGQAWVEVRAGSRPGDHVRRQGEDVRQGALTLRAGTTLGPAAIGVCASLGLAQVPVARRPRVGILATGDEVVPPGAPRAPGQLWSSNSAALSAFVEAAGGVAFDCGIARDDLESTRAAFRRALDQGADLLLSTGGVSVGDFDHVRAAMSAEGAALEFWKVRMKPGKPLAFGQVGGRPIFGLPGNPVSCLVNFLQFVRPVLRRSLGDPRPFLPVRAARLEAPVHHHPGRAELVRVALRFDEAGQLCARPTGNQGSARALGMALAHGLCLVGVECGGLAAGDPVAVQVFDWGFAAGDQADYRW